MERSQVFKIAASVFQLKPGWGCDQELGNVAVKVKPLNHFSTLNVPISTVDPGSKLVQRLAPLNTRVQK